MARGVAGFESAGLVFKAGVRERGTDCGVDGGELFAGLE
jgi:hypothetical protein